MKEWIERFVMEYAEGCFGEDFMKLTPMQRIQTFRCLATFLLPKIKAVDLTMAGDVKFESLASLFTGLTSPQ